MKNKIIELKCSPEFFDDVVEGRKPLEIRFNDRDYQEGDYLRLRKYWKEEDYYNGNELMCRIYKIRSFEGLKNGYLLLYLDNFFHYFLN